MGVAQMEQAKRSKCANCDQAFRADARNAWHQRYCTEPACRTASKGASQRRWLDKPENRAYFAGPVHVARARAWREAHPGYSTRAASSPGSAPATAQAATPSGAAATISAELALQEIVTPQAIDPPAQTDLAVASQAHTAMALQDLLLHQPIVLIGLLAHLSDSTLQDDIALAGRRLLQLGHDQ
jgi:hypothetical protein